MKEILPLKDPASEIVVKYYFQELSSISKGEAYSLLELQIKEIKKHKHTKGESDMWNMYRKEIIRTRYYIRHLLAVESKNGIQK